MAWPLVGRKFLFGKVDGKLIKTIGKSYMDPEKNRPDQQHWFFKHFWLFSSKHVGRVDS
jgi:hypothetical protein